MNIDKIQLQKNNLKENSTPTSGRIKVLMAVLLGLGSVTFGLQIWLSGRIATAGEEINQLEEHKEQLLLQNARLTEKMNEQITLVAVEEKAREMGFVKVHPEQIEYVDSLESFASLSSQ